MREKNEDNLKNKQKMKTTSKKTFKKMKTTYGGNIQYVISSAKLIQRL
jgi:hypothetical protein